MATDNTQLPQTDDAASADTQEFNPQVVELAQADAAAGGTGTPTAPQAPVIPGVPNGQVAVTAGRPDRGAGTGRSRRDH
jgi:hypothetical protein